MLDAGRANPNFFNATARAAFSHLSLFALRCSSVRNSLSHLGFRPSGIGIAERLVRYFDESPGPGTDFFDRALRYARLAMDSRDIALAHTGGLSCPQQAIMCLFSLFSLSDENRHYKDEVRALLRARVAALHEGLGMAPPNLPHSTNYYALIDIGAMAGSMGGEAFQQYLSESRTLHDFLFSLARDRLTLCLPGEGFAAPPWTLRVSLANMEDPAYIAVGRNIRETLETFYREWRSEGRGQP